MGGDSEQKSTTSQQSTTNPYAPAQPLLQDVLSKLGGINTDPNAAQTGAVNTLQSEAGGVPNFGGAGASAVGNLFGSNTDPQQQMLAKAYSGLQSTEAPYTDPNYTNPYSNPAISGWLSTMNNDITNQINGQFAAAGRDLSPANSTALARGLSQGDSQVLANQYNTNVGQQQNAAATQFGGAGATASGVTSEQQVPLQNEIQAIGAAGQIPGLATAPGQTQLAAANTGAQLPYQNLGMLSSLLFPIAGMGGQSTATGNTDTVKSMSPYDQATGWLKTLFPGGFGGVGLPSFGGASKGIG